MQRKQFAELATASWSAFDAAEQLRRVTPAMPILFFGHLANYLVSRPRVLTVGLNPSGHEFPEDNRFLRFPLAEGNKGREPVHYRKALSAYFRTKPYCEWFNSFEQVLKGVGASYYPGAGSTALQTEIGSPVATDPTWSRLRRAKQKELEAIGGPLWHSLLDALEPDIVLISVAQRHLDRIEFEPIDSNWKPIHTFGKTADGSPRRQPYEVKARWYAVGGKRSLFVFGRAAQKPFGLISDEYKQELGRIAKNEWDSNPKR